MSRQSHRVASAKSPFISLAVIALLVLLNGCGPSGVVEGPVDGVQLTGRIRGGQQPVTNAAIQLYSVGTTGDGSSATPLLSSPVLSDALGNFSLTSRFICPSQSTLVYLVASGGNPGLASGTNNAASTMMAALGACGSLTSTSYIFVDEVTTVGSIAALYPYISSFTAIGSSPADAAQLAAAFATVNEYTNIATGTAPGPALPANFYASTIEINTLADIVSTCVNSSGGSAGDGTACGSLFADSRSATGVSPTDTIGALANILNNPASNVQLLFGLTPSAGAPFQPTLTTSPANWQLPIVPIPATPTFSPVAGTYAGEQSVTITDATAGASVFYTIDGSTPTIHSTPYSGAIAVSASETIKAIASQNGRAGNVAAAAYVIQRAAPAAVPTFSPSAGTYQSAQSVTLSSGTAGATIYYTTDGSTPTTSSSFYNGPITVYTSETVQAVAIAQGTSISAIGSAAYVIPSVYGYISTLAGTDSYGYNGDGIAGTSANLFYPYNVTTDAAGNVLIADYRNQRVRLVSPAGIIFTVAGVGAAGTFGDGGPATQAFLNGPFAVALDSNGNLYIADQSSYRIRKVTPSGIISTYAGNGGSAESGDGGPATSASVGSVCAIVTDSANNLFVADCRGNKVRVITPTGIINSVAGNGTAGFSGDGGAASSAQLSSPGGLVLDQSGNLYISEAGNSRIRKVTPAGIISTYAGTGTAGYSGDGGAAVSAQLNRPAGLGIDAAGDLYVADTTNQRIRMITPAGVISTVAGTGAAGFSGDGGPSAIATLDYPSGVRVDAQGNLYIADRANQRVRRITFSTVAPQVVTPGFSLLAGTFNGTQSLVLADPTPGASIYYTNDGSTPGASSTLYTGQITIAASQTIKAIGVSSGYANSAVAGNAYVITNLPTAASPAFSPAPGTFTATQTVTLTAATAGSSVYYTVDGSAPTTASPLYTGAFPVARSSTVKAIAVAPGYTTSPAARGGYFINQGTGIITTFAGTGAYGFTGDGGLATAAQIHGAGGFAFDGSGNVFFTDSGRVRKVSPSGVITTVAGTGASGFSGDGGPAIDAQFYGASFLAFDPAGNLYISDTVNSRIRKVNAAGIITTIAGTGGYIFSGDNGPATAASLYEPEGINFDSAGNLYIADEGNYRIRKVTPAGIITTVAGAGVKGFKGNGGPAINADLDQPSGVAVDNAGNLYIADLYNERIRMVTPGGIISTAAGTGNIGFGGDGGPALSATFDFPVEAEVDNAGSYYILDTDNSRIRKVNSAGIIATVAGSGVYGYNGEGEPATSASFKNPQTIGIDLSGNLYISDVGSYRVRKVSYGNAFQAAAPTFSIPAGTYTTAQSLYLLSATPGAVFYYTTDGSTPTTASTLYAGPIIISTSETLTAIATAPGYTNSLPASVVYTANILPLVATPTFSPAPGSYDTTQTVTISSSARAAIYYTLDGSTPTTASTLYTGALTVSSSTTINAIGAETGYTTSAIGVGGYYLNQGIGIVTTYAGNGTNGASADGGIATASALFSPESVALDSAGNLYLSQYGDMRVRKVTPAGIITTVAGTGVAGFSGDGGPATSAQLYYPNALAIDSAGNLFIGDTFNCRIRKVTPAGIISTVVGNGITTSGGSGNCSDLGDGGYASTAQITQPSSLAVDRVGNLYIGTGGRVRRINPQGIITTVAGTGTSGFTGDGGLATAAQTDPLGLTVDNNGNLYIAEQQNNRVRKVTPAGIITTIAGNGSYGFGGDGGPATGATLSQPYGVAVDGAGNLYISEQSNERLRKVTPAGIINTIAGTGSGGFNGDGLAATLSNLSSPYGIVVDPVGNVYFADASSERIRKISYSNAFQAAPPSFSVPAGNYTTVQTLYLNSATPAASFRYTTDGSLPTVNSTLYTGYISISTSETVTAIAVVPGYVNSTPVSVVYTTNIPPVAATPAFSPAPGNYDAVQSVTLTDSPGVAIYYTTDGSAPTTSSTLYSGPISVSSSRTINAIGAVSGSTNSPIAAAGYLINQGVGIITAIAGNGSYGSSGDGAAATSAQLSGPGKVAVDTAGNVYIADTGNNRIRKVSTGGIITTFAGTGTSSFSGDSGLATAATLNAPAGVAADRAGNVYIADTQNNRIRKVSATGIISTIAGTGTAGFNGDGIPSLSATLNLPTDIAVDNSGNLYLADSTNHRIRKIIATGFISTVAGSGTAGFSGDGGPASAAQLNLPSGVAVDGLGNVYLADTSNNRIRKVTPAGIISTVAGSALTSYAGDNGPATSAGLAFPISVAADNAGNLYIADQNDYLVRKVTAAGIISRVAGGGSGTSLDGGPATAATLGSVGGVAVDSTGNVYLSERYNDRICKVSYGNAFQTATPTFSVAGGTYSTAQTLYLASATPGAAVYYTTDGSTPTNSSTLFTGPITLSTSLTVSAIALTPGYSNSTVAQAAYSITILPFAQTPSFSPAPGSYAAAQQISLTSTPGASIYYTTDGSLPTASSTLYSGPIAVSSSETLNAIAVLSGYNNSAVAAGGFFINRGAGTIITFAGGGIGSTNGDGGPATSAKLVAPFGMAFDRAGNLYVGDINTSSVRRITPAGVISTVAGNGSSGFSGDGGAATSASLFYPRAVAVDNAGNLYITDSINERVRKVTPAGIISTIAGTGSQSTSGDGGLAINASLYYPTGIAVDAGGNIYIAEQGGARIRKINSAGYISTFAGTGFAAFGGDNGPATSALLSSPSALTFDASGNLYFTEYGNQRVRKVTPAGIISTVAGTGNQGYNGDSISATSAYLSNPEGIAVDNAGNFYIADSGNQRVRKVNAAGVISTIAGKGTAGFSGDGAVPTSALLSTPAGVAIDNMGNVYLSDQSNSRIRKIAY